MLDAKLLKPRYKRRRLTGPVNYRDFRETGPRTRYYDSALGGAGTLFETSQLIPFLSSWLKVPSSYCSAFSVTVRRCCSNERTKRLLHSRFEFVYKLAGKQ